MLKSQIDEAKREIKYYRDEFEIKMKELSALNSEIYAKKNFIKNFDNEEGYMRIKEDAKNQTEYVMQNKPQLLGYAVIATFEAILVDFDGSVSAFLFTIISNESN